MNRLLLTPFGLKWNPFNTELPTKPSIYPPKINDFFWRIEQVHVREGGFALIQGDPGTGKSVALRALAERLERILPLHLSSGQDLPWGWADMIVADTLLRARRVRPRLIPKIPDAPSAGTVAATGLPPAYLE
ncbi:hypothetical protein [Ferrovum myxofaciens]|uniref:hypothetical protein n=1 Tax=Ferrovum myxofaciens TaxID=416213 RepID=UPI00235527AD|nr:hypothetical protein [Ferrovum myxofaciens]MBU6995321.1 hypothetical protein [Ferrovum myxofaciens]